MAEMLKLSQDLENNSQLREFIYHLARLALTGRPQDVRAYIARMGRRLRATVPTLADELNSLVREAPTMASPLRGGQVASLPVDSESRLSLARVETCVTLPREPIWSERIRHDLEVVIQERRRSDELCRAGLTATRTVLFTGEPGVGKTLAARWIAEQLQWPLIVLDLGAVMSSFLGRTGQNVRNILDYAKGLPCVLLLDEIDAIAKRRDDQVEVGELKRLVTVLLQQLDDWPGTSLLIAATNHPDLLDPAVWRRFDLLVNFGMPTQDQIRNLLSDLLTENSVGTATLSALTILFAKQSFSDIERAVASAKRQAFILGRPVSEMLMAVIGDHVGNLPKTGKIALSASLVDLGLSQRQAHQLTGVARQTIRKAATRREAADASEPALFTR
jgi:Cdc6-like AAA superfamily ATPase